MCRVSNSRPSTPPAEHTSSGDSPTRSRGVLSKAYWVVLMTLFAFSVVPLLLIKVYIVATGDMNAAWAVVYFGAPISVALIGFVITFLLGVVRLVRNWFRL